MDAVVWLLQFGAVVGAYWLGWLSRGRGHWTRGE